MTALHFLCLRSPLHFSMANLGSLPQPPEGMGNNQGHDLAYSQKCRRRDISSLCRGCLGCTSQKANTFLYSCRASQARKCVYQRSPRDMSCRNPHLLPCPCMQSCCHRQNYVLWLYMRISPRSNGDVSVDGPSGAELPVPSQFDVADCAAGRVPKRVCRR